MVIVLLVVTISFREEFNHPTIIIVNLTIYQLSLIMVHVISFTKIHQMNITILKFFVVSIMDLVINFVNSNLAEVQKNYHSKVIKPMIKVIIFNFFQ